MPYNFTKEDELAIADYDQKMRHCSYKIELLKHEIEDMRKEHVHWHTKKEALMTKYRWIAKGEHKWNAKGNPAHSLK